MSGDTQERELSRSTFLQRNGSYLLIVVIFYCFFLLLTPLGTFSPWINLTHTGYHSIVRIDPGDDAGYYAYLRSAFFDHDLDFFNEKGYYHFDTITPTGYSINYWTIGSALLWIPFFLIGHVIAVLYHSLGYPVSVDGYSFPYYVLTGIGSSLCVLLGLLLNFSLLKNYFSEKASLLATLTLCLATPLPYYTFIRQRMSHSGEFLVIALFIYSWILYRSTYKNLLGSILLGISAGMLCLIRLNSGALLLIPFLDFLIQALRDSYHRRYDEVAKLLRNVMVMGIVALSVVVPQLVGWNILMGKPFPPTGHVSFAVSNIIQRITYVLVGKDWGVFITEPVWVGGLVGLFIFMKREKRISLIFVLTILVSLFICAGFLNEAAFGHRFLLNCNILLSFGLATIIDSLKMKKKMVVAFIISLVLIVWEYFLIIQYEILMEYNNPLFALKAFEHIPTLLLHTPSLLLRSTSFFKLLCFQRVYLASFVDWFFLIVLPCLALLLSGILVTVMVWCFRLRFRKCVVYLVTIALVLFATLDGISFTWYGKKTEDQRYLRYKQAALSSLRRGWPEKALEYLEKARLLRAQAGDIHCADEASLNKYLGSAFNDQAVKLYKDNRVEEALRLFTNAAELYPDSSDIHRNTGVVYYFKVRDREKALYHFQRSVELDPNQTQAEVVRGLIRELSE